MKAIARSQYGDSTHFKAVSLPIPKPKAHEVCIKIDATSLNASDWEFLTGLPVYTRLWGLRKPRITILGSDISGIVIAVGSSVTEYKPGDAVFGDIMEHWGGFAEYVIAPAKLLVAKPEGISHVQAASIPQSASVALQGITKLDPLTPGQAILINGAGGGAGSFAIQFAKQRGVEVTAVDSYDKFEHMTHMGADYVLDYKTHNYCLADKQYDAILDFVASHSVFDNKRALTSTGKYFVVGGKVSNILQTLFFGLMFSIFSMKKMRVLAAQPNLYLESITTMITNQEIIVPIDQEYAFDDIPNAMNYLGQKKAKGKVVINMQPNNSQ